MVELCSVPTACALHDEALAADFYDSYRAPVHRTDMDARALYLAIMSALPWYANGLLALRDVLVRPFGIRTTRDLEPGKARLGLFPILSESNDEVIVGAPDRHLNFKIAVTRERLDERTSVCLTTLVTYNRPIGRLYLALIKPFHVALVKGSLDNAEKRRLI